VEELKDRFRLPLSGLLRLGTHSLLLLLDLLLLGCFRPLRPHLLLGALLGFGLVLHSYTSPSALFLAEGGGAALWAVLPWMTAAVGRGKLIEGKGKENSGGIKPPKGRV